MAEHLLAMLQPITGASADQIVEECPGLFKLEGKGKSKQAKVNAARDHPQLLEKVVHALNAKVMSCHVMSLACSSLHVKSAHQ